MACCVVLTRLPQDVAGDDAEEASRTTSSPSSASQRPNPETPLSCSAAAAAAAPSARRLRAVKHPVAVEHPVASTSKASDFSEPWSKLLSLAKEKSRQGQLKAKATASRASLSRKETAKVSLEGEAVVEAVPPKDAAAGSSKSESNSRSNESETCPSTSRVETAATPSQEARMSRVASRPLSKRTSRPRASSLEWDCSMSESADTPPVPQNKNRKSLKKRRRDASIDMDWAPDDSSSACSDSESTPKGSGGSHQCSICDLTFKRPWRLHTHVQQHLQPKLRPFKCDKDGCSKGYFYKVHLDRHKSRSHSDLVIVTKTLCPSEGCNRIFESQSGLKRHINKIHSVENLKFNCPHCEKKFSKNRQLRFHIAEHTGDPPLRCEKCNAGVFSDKELKRHMRTHKEYPCDVSGCDKIFSTYPALQKHKAQHNKCFQSLQCAHCNKVCTKKSDLRDHVMTHLDQRTIFRCTYDSCPRFYYQERNLKSHIRVKHEKTSNFSCTWENCDMQFLSSKALARHLNVHENGRAEMKRKEGPKAPRKDKGKPKRAMATQLAGMVVIPEVEKTLLAPDRTVEMHAEENPDILTGSKKPSFKPKQSNPLPETPEEDPSSSTFSVNFIPENNIVILQDENGDSLPAEENDSIITSLSGKLFEIGQDGILIEVPENSQVINAVTNSELEVESTDSVHAGPSENYPNNTSLLAQEKNVETVDGGIVLDLGNAPTSSEDLSVSNPEVENILCAGMTKNDGTEAEGVVVELKESPSFDPTTLCEDVNLANPVCDSQTDESARSYVLSATLCAETIVDGPQGESEVFLLIPGQKLATDEASSAAVFQALRSNIEVYSVMGKNSNTGSPHESPECNPVKKMSIDDPSVTSILQPLINDLTKKSGICSSGAEEISKSERPEMRNPAHTHNVICKLAKFIRAGQSPFIASKRKGARSLKGNLQGPTQEPTQSDSSSGSESGDSRSDSGSDDGHNDYSDNEGEVDDNLSGDGDGGNEDDEDGDDEDEADDQAEDEDSGDEEDNDENDNDENGPDGAGYLNEDNNNNNDNSEANSEGPEDQVDPDSSNGHRSIINGSDLGVDRSASQKQKAPVEDEDACSTHSDDLIIDTDPEKGSSTPQHVEQEVPSVKNQAQSVLSGEGDSSKARRRSTRLKSLSTEKAEEPADLKSAKKKCDSKRSNATTVMPSKPWLLPVTPIQEDGKLVFNCPFDSCSRSYTQIKNLHTHIRVKHQKASKFACTGQTCKMQFYNSRDLAKHLQKTGHDQELPNCKAALKRKKNAGSTDKMNSSECESDSSGSDLIQPHKKRKYNIGDDSDSSVGVTKKITGDLSGSLKSTVKEETDDQDLKSPLLKTLPVTSLLHAHVKNEKMFLMEPKLESGTIVACNKLSSKAWIRVLREASRVMKLSLTAAQD